MKARPPSLSLSPPMVNHAMPVVSDGMYEFQAASSGLYLNTRDETVYNYHHDDALVLGGLPTKLGKWEITRIGHGYTIKQTTSGMYCSARYVDSSHVSPPLIVLSPVPAVWELELVKPEENIVRISWPADNSCWRAPTNEGAGPVLANAAGISQALRTWRLCPLGPNNASGPLIAGVYAIQNKVSDTYVSLNPDDKYLGCWPASDLKASGPKMWVVTPLGKGFTIRLQGTDKYCTLQDGTGDRSPISVSTVPAAWRIEATDSPLNGQSEYYRILWGDTDMTWDLSDFGKPHPGNPVKVMQHRSFQPCRLFKFIS